ncbi:hypothetical protein MMO38_00385 [Acinetobacter sp. NIPH 1852]|uniref:hypothetical protein n=1 Tax=Acinetobacter sp. NIPH 1852 TaxID=2923428 RepID=UPI001F4A4D6A|nr:hypothetical protein [Acinetobacter sp. NIPH 1852]MCH7306604.1 hypothetical protein [Acinetobacter sp. NIPH 1852]
MFNTQNLKKNLVVSMFSISALSACTSTLTNNEFKEALVHGNSGAISMLLLDSAVYRKAAERDLDAVTWELLKSTLSKVDVVRQFEKEIGGSYKIEESLTLGNMNQLCLVNSFLLTHKKELPPNIDHSETYNWVESKQKVFINNLNETLGDKRMQNDCRS